MLEEKFQFRNKATATVSIAQKYGLPSFNEESDFDQWKLVTDLPKAKQGKVIFLSSNPKINRQVQVCQRRKLFKDDGVDKLVPKIKELYSVSRDQATFSAYA